jgi:transposase
MNPTTLAACLLQKITTLEQLIEKQSALIQEQAATIIRLQLRIAELEKRKKKNSSNSSKPPSSDGLSKPPRTTSLRQKGKNKSGGQLGHKGETLKQTQHPDSIKRHELTACSDCKNPLSSDAIVGIIKRQVFDIPQPKCEVTEHQADVKYCECCHKTVIATFPDDVGAPVQYGPTIKSWAVYYQQQHFIPEDRLQQLLSDLYGLKLATATLTASSQTAFEALAPFEENALSMVKQAAVKNLDETGFRVSGKTQWLHVASTPTVTYYHVSPKRKSLIEGLRGTVVHDHWKAYYTLDGVEHGLCNQHHLRELKALIEHEKEVWATKMSRLLRMALRCRHFHGDKEIPSIRLHRLMQCYDTIIKEGLDFHDQQTPLPHPGKRGKKPKRIGHNLLNRLLLYKKDVLRFLDNPAVPFTNNEAERDLRMVKCKQKISGGFRSNHGAAQFARIRGFISTARKQGWNILQSIQSVFTGNIPLPN